MSRYSGRSCDHRPVVKHDRPLASHGRLTRQELGETTRERVRAILVTPNNTMLVIKRVRPGINPYWVVPGGGVEPTDPDREAALEREVREEIGGEIDVMSLLHLLESQDEQHYFYLATIKRWSFEDRTGPEFADDSRGEYLLEEVPLTLDGIASIDLKPGAIGDFLKNVLRTKDGLFAQPDLRQRGSAPAS